MNITLVIIFNHRFDKNITVLKKMYRSRFSNILFLVPFYDGTDPQVIPVFESSYQFQGYIAQAYNYIKMKKTTHYLFIGDDLILNPILNENNVLDYLGVSTEDDSYIESLTPLCKMYQWGYKRFEDASESFKTKAVNYQSELPAIQVAKMKAEEYGYTNIEVHKNVKCYKYDLLKHAMIFLYKNFYPIYIEYPLVTGYSDFFVIPKTKLREFAHLSGVFAAMRLFVEIAIPTALMLLIPRENLKIQKDAKLKTPKLWMVTDEAVNFEKNCNYEIQNMEKNWPEDYAYLHPIKLSKWVEGN